ncbi:helix-turn-helix domain-containing protein [Dietzia alimentaria]|uniref:helix-turn-helix domain-containing protein n=1 Tax=Dietzia alimentaria TaxID=665550 RepID=UPI00029AA2DE|nr:helix-turn-helix transcriptional regulator [Dietzia alimentaria]
MTTSLTSITGGLSETLSEAVARRLRGALAELQISHAEAGRRIDINPSGMSRRMKGKHPWDLDELQRLSEACGVDMTYVLTGIRNAENPHPDGPDGGVVRHQGLEPRTR